MKYRIVKDLEYNYVYNLEKEVKHWYGTRWYRISFKSFSVTGEELTKKLDEWTLSILHPEKNIIKEWEE